MRFAWGAEMAPECLDVCLSNAKLGYDVKEPFSGRAFSVGRTGSTDGGGGAMRMSKERLVSLLACKITVDGHWSFTAGSAALRIWRRDVVLLRVEGAK